MMRTDSPVTVDRDQARQLVMRELAQGKYHRQSLPSPSPSTATPTPPLHPPPPHASSAPHVLVILLVILAISLLLIVLLRLRRTGGRRTDKKGKSRATGGQRASTLAGEVLVGAARHRHDAEVAATAADWALAVRERFRAVIATLDERGLLPERADRTADEAARDAGGIMPAHANVLMAASRVFDDIEYGEYVGTQSGYAVISEVDDLVCSALPDTARPPLTTSGV
jgi:hypothetical protein